MERAKALLKAKPSDDAIKFAATCTLVAARKDVVDLFDSHKRLKAYAQQDFASLSPKHAALGRLLWARTLLAMGKVPDAQQALEKPFEDCEDQCDAELLLAAHAQPEKKKKKKGDEETKEEAAEALIPAIVQAMASVAKKGVDGATEDDCGATVALSNLFYVANWPNVTKGYDPSSPQSKLADNWAMVKSKE